MQLATYNGRSFYWTESPGRSGSKDRRERQYLLITEDRQVWEESEAFDAAASLVCPSTIAAWRQDPDNPGTSYQYQYQLSDISITERGDGQYEIRANYAPGAMGTPATAPYKETPVGSASYEYDVSLDSETILFSKTAPTLYYPTSEIALYQAGDKVAPDLRNAINVNEDGQADGIDVLVPTARFTVRYEAPSGRVTESYRRAIEDLVGKVNLDTYLGRDPGTLLFEGCSGSERSDGSWSLSFSLRYRPNSANLTFGQPPAPGQPDKRFVIDSLEGWEYLWFLQKKKADMQAKQVLPEYTVAYKHQVYEKVNFAMDSDPAGPLPPIGTVDE